jgi:CheY-like chemotaxis protein
MSYNNDTGKLRIVIAEDDTDDGEIMVECFENHLSFGAIDWVKNGMELLTYLKESEEKPDIILTDINMPILSGIDVLEQICDDQVLNKIPAFVYSSTLNPIYELKCMKLGTRGFLIKPLSLKGFEEIPKKIISLLQE